MKDIQKLTAEISASMRNGTWRTSHVVLTGFIRCLCGKVHTRSGIGPNSLCTCGSNLYARAWDRK